MKTKFYCSLGKVCGEKPCWRHGVMDSFWPALTRQHPRTYTHATPYHAITYPRTPLQNHLNYCFHLVWNVLGPTQTPSRPLKRLGFR